VSLGVNGGWVGGGRVGVGVGVYISRVVCPCTKGGGVCVCVWGGVGGWVGVGVGVYISRVVCPCTKGGALA
jgi:hypothetical protein